MAELKTKVNNASVSDFLNSVDDEQKKKDSFRLLELFQQITGEKAKMWGSAIVGFGQYHYKSERSSQEGDWPITGFSPRKSALTLYVMLGDVGGSDLVKKLGKCTTGKGCLYIKRLSDVDEKVLEELIKKNFSEMKKKYKA
jgi:hypothetical protein